MNQSSSPALLPRHLSIGILATIAWVFASNHVAARIAFEDGAGVLLAVVCRSATGAVTLLFLVTFLRMPLRMPLRLGLWQLLLGLLIAAQSILLYSAVARIPVAMALLLMSLFPIVLAMLSWLLDGRAPGRRALVLMCFILFGLVFVLDVPSWTGQDSVVDAGWLLGLLFAFASACCFAMGLWISERHLSFMAGPVRSLYTIVLVLLASLMIGQADLLPGSMSLPDSSSGWWALLALSLFYTTGFSVMFIMIPRLDMVRNAPVMNTEPVASLVLGWLFLDQTFNNGQLFGGAIVLVCIVLLAYSRQG